MFSKKRSHKSDRSDKSGGDIEREKTSISEHELAKSQLDEEDTLALDLQNTSLKNTNHKDESELHDIKIKEKSVSSASDKKLMAELKSLACDLQIARRQDLNDRMAESKDREDRMHREQKLLSILEKMTGQQGQQGGGVAQFVPSKERITTIPIPRNLVASWTSSDLRGIKKIKDFKILHSSKFRVGANSSMEAFLRSFVKSAELMTPPLSYAEYNLLLITAIESPLREKVEKEVNGEDLVHPRDLHANLLVLTGENLSMSSRSDEFFEWKPNSKRCSLEDIVTELSSLARLAELPDETYLNRVIHFIPQYAAKELRDSFIERPIGKPTAINILNRLAWTKSSIDQDLVKQFGRTHKLNQVTEDKPVKKQGGGVCIICLKRGHNEKSCWFRDTVKCLLCGNQGHIPPTCDMYQDTVPALVCCRHCKAKNIEDRFHIADLCKQSKN
jgi:hypothetical protein